MNRRKFLSSLAVVAASQAASHVAYAQLEPSRLEIDFSEPGPTIARNFSGLSYETAQLANPAFFSGTNHQLVDLFRGLSQGGVLRLGGGSSEYTTWSDQPVVAPPPFEVFGPDTSKTIKHGTTNTPLAIRNLRDFLDATGWRCIYGLNLGQGSTGNAVAEAAAVCNILGSRLIALQIGNEPDSFRNRLRPATYGPDDFLGEWKTCHAAILAKVPNAQFAGPDISNKAPYFIAFAREAVRFPDIRLLTAHFYAMGPAGSPKSTLEKLLVADPSVQTMSDDKVALLLEEAKQANLPLRMCEGNSCWDGGKPGVSDTLASALWSVDYMLHLAQMGVVGVNFHGGGNGFYTPIAGSPSEGFKKRPEYFGIQFVQQFADFTVSKATLIGASPRVSAYALRKYHYRSLVVINKSDVPVYLALPAGYEPEGTANRLSGPALDSRTAPEFQSIKVSEANPLLAAPCSATLYAL